MLPFSGSSVLKWAVLLLTSLPLFAQQHYVMTTSPGKVKDVCARHGVTQLTTVWKSSSTGIYMVSASAGQVPAITADPDVVSIELDRKVGVPENLGTTISSLTQSTASILEGLVGRTEVSYFGAIVPSNYLVQPSTTLVRLADAQSVANLTGSGITVAIIDTGADLTHPALKSVLGRGYDFISNTSGGSELADLSPAAAASLTQSTASILEGGNLVPLNSSSVGILTQSTASILEGAGADFGHGTMTAGLVHLVAPEARIMPLKAFNADGSSDTYNILRAIYFAVDHGANVISMSFEVTSASPSLQDAIQYALAHSVTLVAASGNDGRQVVVYPAGYNSVIGVGSTDSSDVRSSFTNYGTNSVFVAAPGEGVVTTYPGGNYAAGWGTSFSTPIVAGEAALILQARPSFKAGDVGNAISRAHQVQAMGHGRIDIYQAIAGLVPSTR